MTIEAEERRRATARAADADRTHIAQHRDEILKRCETFGGFVKEAWHVLEPNTHLAWGWALDAMCEHMEAVFARQILRLLMNVPPGTMKSTLVSVMAQAYEWGPLNRPSMSYLTASWNKDFAVRDSRKTRDLIQSAWFQELWPITFTRNAEDDFANDKFGSRAAKPFLGLTSGRGDRLAWDDPHSTEKAESDPERARTARVFRESVTSRINDPVLSAIIGVMQRLHAKDVSGVIDELKMDYVKLILPMEFEVGRRCHTVLGMKKNGQRWEFTDPRKIEGELLFPERFPREVVERDKIPLGAYGVAGQFQQRPTPREGGIFKIEWFTIVDAVPALGKEVRAWDLAATKNGGDFTVGVKMQKSPQGIYYITDVVRLRGSPKDVDDAIKNTATRDTKAVRIRLPQDPGQAGKAQKAQHASLLDGFTFRVLPVTGDKHTRASPLASQAEAGNVKLLRGPWNAAFLEEIGMFPNANYDDQVDAAADAYNELVASAGANVPITAPLILTAPRSSI